MYYSSGNRYEGGWMQHTPHGNGVMYYASPYNYAVALQPETGNVVHQTVLDGRWPETGGPGRDVAFYLMGAYTDVAIEQAHRAVRELLAAR